MDNGRLAVVAVDGRFALDRLALGGRGMGTRRRGARGGTRGPAPGGHRGSRLCDGRGRRGLQALVRVVQHGRGILGGVHCASSCSAMGERGAAPAQAGWSERARRGVTARGWATRLFSGTARLRLAVEQQFLTTESRDLSLDAQSVGLALHTRSDSHGFNTAIY
jgi:hypothetical protein